VIYSPALDKYYVGETENLNARIIQHNTAAFKGSFTSKTSDWVLYVSLICRDRSHARKVESFIKRMKSRKFIQDLKDDIVMQNEIISKFQGAI
jgi:putative endonuclease